MGVCADFTVVFMHFPPSTFPFPYTLNNSYAGIRWVQEATSNPVSREIN